MGTKSVQTNQSSKQIFSFLFIVGIIFIAFNLRPGMTSVGPLLGMIRDDIGLQNWSAGLLTSLPLIAFALISPIVPTLSNRLSSEWAMVLGLLILIVGMFIRSTSFAIFLFVGTILVGLGIAICNVLLPGVIKDKFPSKVAFMTSIYSTVMGIMASIASGVSVPLAEGLQLGWKVALIVWSIPAFLATIVWLYFARKNNDSTTRVKTTQDKKNNGRIWRSPIAWQVALFMGLQSSLFYVSISWLPEILHDKGLSIVTAGWMLSYTQIIGLPASFIVPVLAGRMRSQRLLVLMLGLSAIFGFIGLIFSSNVSMYVISCTFLGITLGGAFALALTFLAIRAKNAKDANDLSGMAQSIGYLLAALGPVVIGYLHDLTGEWKTPLFVMVFITILVILFGLGAGRDRYVLD